MRVKVQDADHRSFPSALAGRMPDLGQTGFCCSYSNWELLAPFDKLLSDENFNPEQSCVNETVLFWDCVLEKP